MKNEKLILVAAVLAIAFYWFRVRGNIGPAAGINLNTGRPKGKRGLTPSTFGATASTGARMGRQPIPFTQANAGTGRGFVNAPVKAISALQNPTRRNIGTAFTGRVLSRSWGGAGTAGIAPVWPSSFARANGTVVRTGTGRVQVPSYAAVPTVTRGAGGGGSVVFLGGSH